MTIDVVLTTFNGEKYIIEQLDSIRKQSQKPDRVIICDDCSTDNTCNLIGTYINDNKLNDWQLYINKNNKGWKRNFIDALSYSNGDYVFLSDQDDIWFIDKVESMIRVMEGDKNIQLLAGNSLNFYDSISGKLPPLYSLRNKSFNLDQIWCGNGISAKINRLLKEKKGDSGAVIKVEFNEALFAIQRQGCVMAVKKELIKDALKYSNLGLAHDTLLWFLAAINDSLFIYEKQVINYRHHQNNTGFNDTLGKGLSSKSEIRKIDVFIEQICTFKEMLNSSSGKEIDEKNKILDNIIDYSNLRKDFLKNKRISDGMILLKSGKKMGKRQLIFDFLLAFMT